MIDNYDSFTFNLVHYFQDLGQTVKVLRNNEVTISEIEALNPQYIVISPGPCDPDKAGLSLDIIKHFIGIKPILGVCLGHQCIAQALGGSIIKANQVMHGKTCNIEHTNSNIFTDLPQPLTVTRYHSLIINKNTLPEALSVIAWSLDGAGNRNEIMGVAHKTLPIVGVQFHPESIMTKEGKQLLANFIDLYNNFA